MSREAMAAPHRVLVAEDDPGMRELLARILRGAGYVVDTAEDGQAALEHLRRAPPEVLVTDLQMPRLGGMELLRRARLEQPGLPVIVLTAFGTLSGAVEAMRLGAFDFLSKPLPDPDVLRQGVARALAARLAAPGAAGSARAPAAQVSSRGAAAREHVPVYADPAFGQVLDLARAVAGRDTTVLFTGESGVGKEVVARVVHESGPRAVGPFVAVNCAALPESLLESELFGHEKGAFTGAVTAHPGLFEQAHGGTLLLDEVGEMQPALQAKLLRVLEVRLVVRLGSTREREVDVRVLAATNRDLESEVAAGRFRQDLLYRLQVFPIHIPPLRDRPADILPLARHFLQVLGAGPGRTPPRLVPAAEAALRAHLWPGNVRELMNAVERATILADRGEIRPEHLGLPPGASAPPAGQRSDPLSASAAPSSGGVTGALDSGSSGGAIGEVSASSAPAPLTLKEMERLAILEALEAVGGNRKAAAKRLGIALRTLQYKLKDYGIT